TVAAFLESPNDFVQRWNGTTWGALGSGLDPVVGQTMPYSQLRADSSGDLRIIVSESSGSDVNDYLYKWDTTSSSWLGAGVFRSTIGITESDLKVDVQGRSVVATYE